jgi:hypothetical protein
MHRASGGGAETTPSSSPRLVSLLLGRELVEDSSEAGRRSEGCRTDGAHFRWRGVASTWVGHQVVRVRCGL